MNEWAAIINDLRGKPFRWQGRGPDAYDCWGLVIEVLARRGLPSPGDFVTDTQACAIRTIATHLATPSAVKLSASEPGAIVLMSSKLAIHHAGIATPYGVLHTVRQFGACLSQVVTLRMQGYQRIEYYKWAV